MKHISYEDVGFDEGVIDASEDYELLIPIGMSDSGIYNLAFRSRFMYRGEAMSSYMIHGNELYDELVMQSILLNGAKRYSPESLKFWLYNQNENVLKEIENSGIPHIERVVTLLSAHNECIDFWRDLKELSDRRFQLFRGLSKRIGESVFDISQYNSEVHKLADFGDTMARIVVLVKMDGFFKNFERRNKEEQNARLLKSIEPYFRELTHGAKQGIHIVFSANRDFFECMPSRGYGITSQVIGGIFNQAWDTYFLKNTNFEKAFENEDLRCLHSSECLMLKGQLSFGCCMFDKPEKITIPYPNNLEGYINKIKEAHKTDALDKIKGCLFGGACGDALGAPIEFLQDFSIFKDYGENGITELELCDTGKGKKALVTDDTQMTLFTAAGMIDALKKYALPTSSDYIKCIYENYMSWLTTQEDFTLPSYMSPSWLLDFEELRHRRGPGNTCLSALRFGHNGSIECRINSSKGCGGVMRAAPIGFLAAMKSPMNIKEIGLLGAESAAITHGHELGFTPAAFLAMTIAYILSGRTVYEAVLLSKNTLTENFHKKTDFRDRLMGLVERALVFARTDYEIDDLDAIRELGEGWVAEETLAIAIYCSVRYSDNFERALIAAVNHSGDSDSTGAVTGNILGAYIGYEKIPIKFKENIDVEEAIESVVSKFSNFC